MFGLFRSFLIGTIVIVLLIFNDSVSAQSVANYSVTRTTGVTYNSIISSGNSFSAWRYSGAFSEDDNRSEATDIGFDYWYNGQRYTQFSVSTNGFIDFSSSTDDGGPQCDDYGYCNVRFSDSNAGNGTWLALAPFYDDMTTGGGVDPLGTSIKYLLSGTAPNRILTVEWDAMAVYQNTTPDLNFQVKIYETSGAIEYVYETMNSGVIQFSYTIGINAGSISNPPTTSELLTQQSANSASFSNSPQNNLNTMPAANSSLQFTPLVPANPAGSLTFSAITNTGMTLNWTEWATNEVGYVIYYSTDDATYYFSSQTAANATSAAIAGLSPSTTYYWKVYAVTEGTLSTPLSGNATTLAPGTITSVRSGRWSRTNTWDCGCIPTSADNVIIQDGHTVSLRGTSEACNDLTIGQGISGIVRFNNNNAGDLTVNGNIIINNGATLDVNTTSNTTHTMNLKGNLSNNGTINLQSDANSFCATNFIKTDGNQIVSGTGPMTTFYTLNIDKSQKINILDITSLNFSCDPDALSFISGGTFKFSSSGTNNFSLFGPTKNIPANGKIWMNSANSSMSFSAGINLFGDLVLDAGTIAVGDALDENIISFGGKLEVNGGNITIAGRYDRNTSESTSNYVQTNGTLTLPVIGSTSTVRSPFGMDVVGSSLNISGGSIILEREGGSGTEHLGYNTSGLSSNTVTGGTLQVGNANTPAGQIMQLNVQSSIGNLLLSSSNATAQLITSNLSVLNDVTLTAGILNENNLDITLAGNWLATGGNFQASASGTVLFNGGNQSITTAGSAFNHLLLSGTGNKSFQDNLDVNGNLTNNTTIIMVNSGFLASLGGNWTNNGSFTRNDETITFDGAANQEIAGSSISNFTNITVNKSGGNINIESAVNLYQTLGIQSATILDADGTGAGVLTLKSNATEDSRISTLAAGASITGDLIFEKYTGGNGLKYWRHISSAVINAPVSDIQQEIPVSGTFAGNNNGTGGIPSNAYPSLYYYDNTIGLASETLDDRWVNYPAVSNTELLSTTANKAQGYAIWVRETGAITYDLTGPVNQGTIDFKPTGNYEGWNLLGNPYPSDIDWDAASGWTKSNIQGNTIHIWNGSQYLTWNGSTGSLGNGFIAKGQGFWIEASAVTVGLTATESVKTSSNATTYRTFDNDRPSIIELSVTASGYKDRTYIQFNDSSAFEFDVTDASKLNNSIFNLSTLSADSVELSINLLNGNICAFDVPVRLSNTWNDSYSFAWTISKELLDVYQIKLEDHYTTEIYDINSGATGFNFGIEDSPESKSGNRFVLHFETSTIDNIIISANQNCDDISKTSIILPTSQFGVEYALWLDGMKINSLNGTGEMLKFAVDSNYVTTGINSFVVKATGLTCSAQQREFAVDLKVLAQPVITYDADQNILQNSTGQAGQWYSEGNLISDNPSSNITPNLLLGGVYSIAVSSENCTLQSPTFLVTAMEDVAKSNIINVYPNPATEYIEVRLEELIGQDVSISITDINGKVFVKKLIASTSERINLNNIPPGIYILMLESNTGLYKSRFIKL